MNPELLLAHDSHELATLASQHVGAVIARALEHRDLCHVAFSGGRTPSEMFVQLVNVDVAWERVEVYQVDERIATDMSVRNLPLLTEHLEPLGARVHAMDVSAAHLTPAAHAYADALPLRFDLIHLGLGADGHTASLVPGDPVLEREDSLVAITNPYQGHRRMTLTYPALARAYEVMWLVSGSDKATALAELMVGDASIPAGRVRADLVTIVADRDAIGDLSKPEGTS